MPRAEDGFTLIEVLVSMLVIGVGIAGLIHAGAQNARTFHVLEGKTYAGIVADNVIIEARESRLFDEEAEGFADMAGTRYNWTLKSEETEDSTLRVMDIQVRRDGENHVLVRRRAVKDLATP